MLVGSQASARLVTRSVGLGQTRRWAATHNRHESPSTSMTSVPNLFDHKEPMLGVNRIRIFVITSDKAQLRLCLLDDT